LDYAAAAGFGHPTLHASPHLRIVEVYIGMGIIILFPHTSSAELMT